MISSEDVVPYLLRRGLISPAAVVEGDLSVLDVSRRNRNFEVTGGRGPSYLLKQAATLDAVATVAHEAQIYEMLASGEFQRFLPESHGYDSEQGVLVLELLPNAQDLRQYHARLGRFPAAIASRLGTALASLHRLTAVLEDQRQIRATGDQPAWALSINRPPLQIMLNASAASLEVIRTIQRFPDFCDLLDQLRGEWQTKALIHFDLRWENCLVSRRRGQELKIIDWEFAAPGDPYWDVASVFASYLNFWVQSIPLAGKITPEKLPEMARHPLAKMHPAMCTFWTSYASGMSLTPLEAERGLLVSCRFAAARLLELVYAESQHHSQVTDRCLWLLQLAHNMLLQPEIATIHLLGIHPLEGVAA